MRRTNDFVHRAGWTGRLISPWLTPSDALAGDVAGGLWCPGASYISPVSQQASPHRHVALDCNAAAMSDRACLMRSRHVTLCDTGIVSRLNSSDMAARSQDLSCGHSLPISFLFHNDINFMVPCKISCSSAVTGPNTALHATLLPIACATRVTSFFTSTIY